MTALPIGTLLRSFKNRLAAERPYQKVTFRFPPSKGRDRHDIYGHLLGGALPTPAGERLANEFALALSPTTRATKSAVEEHLSRIPSLDKQSLETYVGMILYYKEAYSQDGTIVLAEQVINSDSDSRAGEKNR
jgi:hypothetical protein